MVSPGGCSESPFRPLRSVDSAPDEWREMRAQVALHDDQTRARDVSFPLQNALWLSGSQTRIACP